MLSVEATLLLSLATTAPCAHPFPKLVVKGSSRAAWDVGQRGLEQEEAKKMRPRALWTSPSHCAAEPLLPPPKHMDPIQSG